MEYLTIEDAATLAKLRPSTIRLAIRAGELEVVKIGRRVYIRHLVLKNFVDRWFTDELNL